MEYKSVNGKQQSRLLLLLVCVVWAGAAVYKYVQTQAPEKPFSPLPNTGETKKHGTFLPR
jgi:hypothetical protein